MGYTHFFYLLNIVFLSLFTDFYRIFAPNLVRDLFSDEVRPINTYSNLMQLKSVQYAIC